MASSDFFQFFEGASFELVGDHAKGHHSDFVPPTMRRQRNSYLSPVNSKQKLQLSRWDSSSCPSSPVKPMKRSALPVDKAPVLKRLINPPPMDTLHDVLRKPVRRLSFEYKLDSICGVNSMKGMTTADLLSSVLNNLVLLDEDSSVDSSGDSLFDEEPMFACPVL
jgi:hypothetical protein